MKEYFGRYGFIGFIKMAMCYLKTRLFFPGARLIRFPIEVRNKRCIDFGRALTTGTSCRIEAFPDQQARAAQVKVIKFGDNVEINDNVHIAARQSIKIGNNVLIASKVFITDLSHGSYGKGGVHDHPDHPPSQRALTSEPVTIEDNVWIGEFVSILPGVTIGKGSIIGSLSVVSKDVPKYSIAVGSPARVIKQFDPDSKKWLRVEEKQ